MRKIPREQWIDSIREKKDFFYRLAMAVDVPFTEFTECRIHEVDGKIALEPAGITVWEIRQRAYFYGQKITAERVEIRDAIISAEIMLHRKEEDEDKPDVFLNKQYSVGYELRRPLSEYAKKRREYVKLQRQKDGKPVTGKN